LESRRDNHLNHRRRSRQASHRHRLLRPLHLINLVLNHLLDQVISHQVNRRRHQH
jgi:hypothetical protein